MGVVVRYYSHKRNEFVTTFLGLIDLNGGNADNLLSGLERLINLYNLDIKKLLGIGADNAAVMTGVHNGLYAKIKAKYNLKNLILVRCVCHSLQLAVCAATAKSFPPNINFLVKETHNWFSCSSIRQKAYARVFKLINNDKDNPNKIPLAAPTRWLSIEKAIKTILSMWLELKTHFNMVNDISFETSLLKTMYNDQKNFLYITFLGSVLSEVQKVNLAFEAQFADHAKLFTDLFHLLQSLTNKIIIPTDDFDYISGELESIINNNCYLGYSFEKACDDSHITESDKYIIKQNLIQFVKTLIYEIRAKLPTNFKLLEKISSFSVKNVFLCNPENTLNVIREFEDDVNEIEELENSLKNLKLYQWKNLDRTDQFWIEVYQFKNSVNKNPFQKLSLFVLKLLSYPYSNAEVERAFSAMNFFKNKIRNRMALNTVNSLIHIKYGLQSSSACCSSYDLPASVFVKINSNETYKKSKYYIKTNIWPEEEENLTLFENIVM